MPLHALELTLDAESDQRVRDLWRALVDAGLPSQALHTGATNAPHVTVLAAPLLDAHTEQVAARHLATVLPERVAVAGLVLFGSRRRTLAQLLRPSVSMLAAVRSVAHAAGADESVGWVPHVTLARRLTGDQLGLAATVLAESPPLLEVTVSGVRRWDPDAGRTFTVA